MICLCAKCNVIYIVLDRIKSNQIKHNHKYPLRHGYVRRPPYFWRRSTLIPYLPNRWRMLRRALLSSHYFRLLSSPLLSPCIGFPLSDNLACQNDICSTCKISCNCKNIVQLGQIYHATFNIWWNLLKYIMQFGSMYIFGEHV